MLTKVRVLNKKTKKEATYQIVSAEDADFEGGKISVSSPIGKALMGDRLVIGVARDYHIRELGPSAESGAIIAAKPSRDSQLLIRLAVD